MSNTIDSSCESNPSRRSVISANYRKAMGLTTIVSFQLKKPQISSMLANMGMEFEGRLHCGLDDARNIARILIRLMEDGSKPLVNERLSDGRLRYVREQERMEIANKQIRRHQLKTVEDVEKVTEGLETLKMSGDTP